MKMILKHVIFINNIHFSRRLTTRKY